MAEEEKNQEELAKEWEEALKQQTETEDSVEAGESEQVSSQESAESQEDIMAAWQEALAQQEGEKEETEEAQEPQECDSKIELLKDIPLEITVEIGSTKLPLEEILNLHTNSVVELDRLVDEPVDIKINGKLVAKGKLYVVKENYGIEITQIITPEERLKLIEE